MGRDLKSLGTTALVLFIVLRESYNQTKFSLTKEIAYMSKIHAYSPIDKTYVTAKKCHQDGSYLV